MPLDLERELVEVEEIEWCLECPVNLISRMRAFDPESAEEFPFDLHDPSAPWFWQRGWLDWVLSNPVTCTLKARQLGVTWMAGALCLQAALTEAGSRCLWFSTKEDQAVVAIQRIWTLFESLPLHLRFGVEVLKPARGALPTSEIVLRHPNGRVSVIKAFTSSPRAGHGETAKVVVLDEFSRQEYARDAWKAALPTALKGAGRIVVISTGNGVSSATPDGDFRGGNFYHYLWTHSSTAGVAKRFLRWDTHPDRDELWYQDVRGRMSPSDVGEQYPANELEAFILTGSPFFDHEALLEYADIGEPELWSSGRFDGKGRFVELEPGRAQLLSLAESARSSGKDPGECLTVWVPPEEGKRYAIAADVASGNGLDFSSAHVVDLGEMQVVAALHGKMGQAELGEQLHFLGRWYNMARLAVECQGGWGEAVTILLRDGRDGRPAYPNLYRHRQELRSNRKQHDTFGFPMTSKTRPLVTGGLERVVRERVLPWLPLETLQEMHTFVHHETGTSPRALDGSNDDRVMSLAIVLDLYRQFGDHGERDTRSHGGRRHGSLGRRTVDDHGHLVGAARYGL